MCNTENNFEINDLKSTSVFVTSYLQPPNSISGVIEVTFNLKLFVVSGQHRGKTFDDLQAIEAVEINWLFSHNRNNSGTCFYKHFHVPRAASLN